MLTLIATLRDAASLAIIQSAHAQTDLSAYADAEGYLDVQKLLCAQLAGTWQGDTDILTAWCNGLARKHYLDIKTSRRAEHEVIEYCKAHPDQLLIEAIASFSTI